MHLKYRASYFVYNSTKNTVNELKHLSNYILELNIKKRNYSIYLTTTLNILFYNIMIAINNIHFYVFQF